MLLLPRPSKILLTINVLKNVIRLFQLFTNPMFSWKKRNIKIKNPSNTGKPDWQTSDRGTFDETLDFIHASRGEHDFEIAPLEFLTMVLLFSFKCFINCVSKLFKDNKLFLYQGNLKEDDVKCNDRPQIFQQKNSELLSQDRQLGTEQSYILNVLKKNS